MKYDSSKVLAEVFCYTIVFFSNLSIRRENYFSTGYTQAKNFDRRSKIYF